MHPTPEPVHDTLVKFLFSNPADAASALAPVLPKALAQRLDWASPEQTALKLVDPKLKEFHSDILFSVRCDGREAFLYVLFEHQSSPDDLMPFRMLRYITLIWGAFLKKNPEAKKLPPVIPVVLHHGQSGWTAPIELASVIDAPSDLSPLLQAYLPNFQFVVDDLAHVNDQALRQRSLTAIMAAGMVLLQRAPFSADLVADLRTWADVFAEVAAAPNGLDALRVLMEYTARVAETDHENIRQFAKLIGPTAEQAYMTAAQKIEQKGREEGRLEGQANLLLRLLERRFGPIPSRATERVRQSTPDELERFSDRVLTASSLDEVLADN
jgi:hypothetical protein